MDEEKSRLSDEKIAKNVQSGKVDDFGLLIERYDAKIKRYARKFLFGHEDAEDMAQEVFLKAFVNIQSFDAERKFSPWIYRIAHNEFINAIKKKSREPLSFFDIDIFIPYLEAPEKADSETEKREIREMLEKGLAKLGAKYREVLVLHYFEDLSYKEIAEVLWIPVATVGIRLKRAKELIKKEYEKYNR